MLNDQMKILVEERKNFADSIAVALWRAHRLHDVDDLKAQAYFGLVQAVERWPKHCLANYGTDGLQPSDMAYFNEYVRRRILGEIIDYIRCSDYVTRTTRKRNRDLIGAGSMLGSSPELLAKRTGLSVEQVRTTLRAIASAPKSLDELDETALISTAEPNEESRFESEILTRFADEIEKLDSLHRVIVVLHYYLEMDLKNIALQLGLAESKVSRLHTVAVLHIHTALVDAAVAAA